MEIVCWAHRNIVVSHVVRVDTSFIKFLIIMFVRMWSENSFMSLQLFASAEWLMWAGFGRMWISPRNIHTFIRVTIGEFGDLLVACSWSQRSGEICFSWIIFLWFFFIVTFSSFVVSRCNKHFSVYWIFFPSFVCLLTGCVCAVLSKARERESAVSRKGI